MWYCFFVLLSLIFIFLMLAKKQKQIDFITNLAESILIYFCFFVIISGILFVFNRYSLLICVILTFFICLFGCIISFKRFFKNKIKFVSIIKDSYITYLAIVWVLIFTVGNFGFFGMGQDQGVYQTEAINLLNDNNNWTHDIDTYSKLPEGEYKQFYEEQVKKIAGYDISIESHKDNIPGVYVDDETSEVEGTWHAIPTFASVLALSSKLFGLQNMAFIQTIFFACLLILFESLLRNRNVNPVLRAVLIILLGICPQLLWVKKSTLTECFLSLLIVSYLYYILHPNENKKKLSALTIITYCFFHVSAFTLIPVFLLNYWLLYCTTKDKKFINYTKLSLIGYVLGFFMMLIIQPRYTILNHVRALSFIPMNYLAYVILFAFIVAWLITVLIHKKYNFKLDINKTVKKLAQIFSIIVIIYLVIIIKKCITIEDQTMSLFTIISYSVLSGFVIMPCLIYLLLTKKYENTKETNIIIMMFLWCIIVYSVVMKSEINYYYYYGRYLAPFISIIIILFAELIKNKKLYYIFIPLLGIILLLPYSNVIRTEQDDTRMQWNDFVKILDSIDKGDVVLIDTDLRNLFFFPLNAKQNNDVYFVTNRNFEETLEIIDGRKENILYLSKEKLDYIDRDLEVVNRFSTFFSEDDGAKKSKITSLPAAFNYKGYFQINLYRIKEENK